MADGELRCLRSHLMFWLLGDLFSAPVDSSEMLDRAAVPSCPIHPNLLLNLF